MDVMPQIVMPQIVMPQNVMTANVMPQTVVEPPVKKNKQSYKSIMAEILKPLPKDDSKPNINLGGGHFSKLDKI